MILATHPDGPREVQVTVGRIFDADGNPTDSVRVTPAVKPEPLDIEALTEAMRKADTARTHPRQGGLIQPRCPNRGQPCFCTGLCYE